MSCAGAGRYEEKNEQAYARDGKAINTIQFVGWEFS